MIEESPRSKPLWTDLRGIATALGACLILGWVGPGEVRAEASRAAEPPPELSAAPGVRSLAEQVGLEGAKSTPVASVDRLTIEAVAAKPDPDAGLPAVGSAPSPGLASIYSNQFGTVSENFDFDQLPGRLKDPQLRRLWIDGLDFELREQLLESARRYEQIAAAVPEESFTYWRIARNYWRHGESLAHEAKAERLRYFELSEDWAARGIRLDPDCAACMLWKFVAMGRQATTKGLMSAAGDVKEMEGLLRDGIELKPSDSDNPGNSTLGNLYYAGAVFYRVIPDWFWLKWFVGVRGDKERALEYIREAVELAPIRVDYRVELGAVLLCLGEEKSRSAATEEGLRVLEEARGLDPFLSTDHLDLSHTKILMEHPEKACGYSRDGFLDLKATLEEAKASR